MECLQLLTYISGVVNVWEIYSVSYCKSSLLELFVLLILHCIRRNAIVLLIVT